ncbi:MAG: hypothetical protein BJ554DRAFT_138 [Olpidium bornovanus]|uniref:Uncharacterized protein n=1 Tax=Olpidium bornovanus TaxID=278681 RepID=A0A8H8DIC8_9FUNG|nr:MAG: hypothetical protein BJ554DRAFT_138 [Olpidium bornovanus]
MAESMSDPDLAVLRQPVKPGVRRPEFVAAAAAARERELAATAQGAKSALPPVFVPPRPPVPSARLADLSSRGKPGAGRDPEDDDVRVANEPLPPATPLVKPSSTRGKPSLLETIVRRNAARRGDTASQSSAATTAAPPANTRIVIPATISLGTIPGRRPRLRLPALESGTGSPRSGIASPERSPTFDQLEDDEGGYEEERPGKQNSANQAPETPTRSTGRRLHSPRLASIPDLRPPGTHNRSNHKQQASNSSDTNDPFVLSSVAPVANGKGTPVLFSRGQLAGDEGEGPRPGRHMREAEDLFGGDDDDDSDFVPEEDSDEVEEEFEGMGGLPLYEFDCLPEHLRESQDIMTGYRIEYSTMQCIRSIFAWHNDTAFALGFSVIHFSTTCDLVLRHKLVLATSTVTALGLWIPWTNAFYSGFFRRLHRYYYLMIIAPVMLMAIHSLSYPGSDMAFAVFQDSWAPICVTAVPPPGAAAGRPPGTPGTPGTPGAAARHTGHRRQPHRVRPPGTLGVAQ